MTVYGRNSVAEALELGLEIKSAAVEVGKEDKFQNLCDKLKAAGIPVQRLQKRAMDQVSGSQKHQGILAELVLPENIHESAEEEEALNGRKKVLALDGITDTGNLGAIVRSSVLFGFEAIVLPKDASARITPQTVKSSAGSIYQQNIYYINSINQLTELAASQGFQTVGLAGEATETLDQAGLSTPILLILGSEHEGIRKSVKRRCSKLARIPTTRKLDSLNASVAAAIAMWEVFKQG